MMHAYLKDRPAWVQLLLFLGMAAGIFLLASFVALLILSKVINMSLTELADSSKWDYNNPDLVIFIRGMLLAQFAGLFLLPSILFGYFSHPEPLKYIGLKKPIAPLFIILAIVCMLVSLPLVEWLGLLNRNASFSASTEKWLKQMEESAQKQLMYMLSHDSMKDYVLNLVFIAGFAAVGEELFFRGVLQKIFIRMFKNPWMGIVLTAALFSAFHMQFYGFLPRLVLGIILGAIYWYSGSLWMSILGHFFYNGFIVTLAFFKPEIVTSEEAGLFDPSILVIPGLASLLAIIAIIWYMHKRSTVSYAEVYETNKKTDEFSF